VAAYAFQCSELSKNEAVINAPPGSGLLRNRPG
jgi:hypothetical protein